MKIAILNGYVRENKGDAALMSVLAQQLQEEFPRAEICIASMEDPAMHPDFEGFTIVGSMWLYSSDEHIGRIRRIIRKLVVAAVIDVLWPLLPFRKKIIRYVPSEMRGELEAIEDADLVVLMGGGYFNARDTFLGSVGILFLTMGAHVAERLGKMVMLAPQSFGPFHTNWQRRRIRNILNGAKLVCVREDTSYLLLKHIGVKEELMVRAIDSGFAYRPLERPRAQNEKMRVGITARQWLAPDKQEKYEKALAAFIVYVEKKYQAEVVLIPQVTSSQGGDDDRIVESRICALARDSGAHPTQITDEIDLSEMKDLYSTFSYTVGTRFHSVIFSLTSFVPSMAIEYEHKTSGILHDLGLDEWWIQIEEVTTDKLVTMFDSLVKNHESYIAHLENVIPSYIEKVHEVPLLIQKMYQQR